MIYTRSYNSIPKLLHSYRLLLKAHQKICFTGINSHYSTTNLSNNKKIRIGCGSGFWGDTPTAVPQLVKHGKLNYLVLDYLSEITMSLLVAAQQKNPDLGWCPDFAQTVGSLFPQIKEQGIKVISNAGGVNPTSCMKTMLGLSEKMGTNLKMALVTGDDLLSNAKKNVSKDICQNPAAITSANAYLGAGPIVRALELGADIVILGRCTDSALALGPLVHEFKWKWNDLDKVAVGSLAGHLIECGAQSTGGIFTDWEDVTGWEYNGFPIAECNETGEFLLTKPDNTGGLINKGTVAEQLLYEIDDPSSYILPDSVCDFSNVSLKEVDGGVWVSGAKGKPPTEFYKVGGTWMDGYKCTVVCPVIGPKAREKSHKVAQALLTRARGMFHHFKLPDFTKTYIQILGTEEAYGNNARKPNLESRDVVLWISVHHSEKKALEMFAREIASSGTGMAPGLTTAIGGRPKPSPVLRFFSYLYPKNQASIKIRTSDGFEENYVENEQPILSSSSAHNQSKSKSDQYDSSKSEDGTSSSNLYPANTGTYSYKLSDLAWLRSGDKGDNCNIGVIARDESYYGILSQILTAEKVSKYFEHKFINGNEASCIRYNVPGVHGFNFVLKNSLGGGGIGALNPDPQGKGYAQMLADFPIENVRKLK